MLNIDKKPIRIIAIVVAIIVVVWLYRRIREKIKEAKDVIDDHEVVEKMSHDISPNDLSYTDAQYQQYATTVYHALNDKTSGFWGVDQDKIYSVYNNMKTVSDVLKLHVVFGRQEIDAAWTMRADGTYRLDEALPRLLTKRQLKKLNRILRDNGVDYQYA